MRAAVCDTETTGLYAHAGHEIWEISVKVFDTTTFEVDTIKTWQLPVDLAAADPMSLTISGYYDRRVTKPNTPVSVARTFARLTHGVALIGAVPSFDERFLTKLLLANGACPGWHYQPIDVETLAVGWLIGQADALVGHELDDDADEVTMIEAAGRFASPPWDSNSLSRAIGVDPDQYARHTSAGDVEWAFDIYSKIMSHNSIRADLAAQS